MNNNNNNDGRIFDIDLDRCSGCHACVVACLDQNDIDTEKEECLRDVSVIKQAYSVTGKLGYVSLACIHCSDAPCVVGCPTGCLRKDANGLVAADTSLCIGCHSCVMYCMCGAPRFDAEGKVRKCDGCATRVECGLVPACVRVCPTKALKYDTVQNIEQAKKGKMLKKLMQR